VFWVYEECGINVGTSETELVNSTSIPYPDKEALYQFLDNEWVLIFGIDKDGQITVVENDVVEKGALDRNKEQILFSEETEYGLVEVKNTSINTLYIAGVYMGAKGESSYVANLLPGIASDASVCVVGLGCGNDIAHLDSLPSVASVDVVEINPAILETLPYFIDTPFTPKVTIHLGDAGECVVGKTFDYILSDPEESTAESSRYLYTAEFLQNCHAAINTGGAFIQRIGYLQKDDAYIDYISLVESIYGGVAKIVEDAFIVNKAVG